jgi:hypothetical protein
MERCKEKPMWLYVNISVFCIGFSINFYGEWSTW